jgi:hypothetical protein
MMTSFSRKALVLLVALTLATTAVSAAPRSQTTPQAARTVASVPVDFFVQLWNGLTGLWTKNGCSADPSGSCLPSGGSTLPTKNGCSLDPDGRCLPVKNGCSLDPNGRCLPGSSTAADNGCSLDPSGRCVK